MQRIFGLQTLGSVLAPGHAATEPYCMLMKQKVTPRNKKVTVEWTCIEGRVDKQEDRIIHFIKNFIRIANFRLPFEIIMKV